MKIQTGIHEAEFPLARTRESYIREAAERVLRTVSPITTSYFDSLPDGNDYLHSIVDASFDVIDMSGLSVVTRRDAKTKLLEGLLPYAGSSTQAAYLLGELGGLAEND